jgi:hypothetical protein
MYRIWCTPAEGLFLPYTGMTRQEPKIDNWTCIFCGNQPTRTAPVCHTASATENDDLESVQASKPQRRKLRVPRATDVQRLEISKPSQRDQKP